MIKKTQEYIGIIKNSSLVKYLKRVSFPGFDKVPLYEVGRFFVKGLMQGALSTRASSIAFNFFLAIFPAVIFFFTLIPYIPINNFQEELLKILQDVLPNNAYLSIKDTLEDIVLNKRSGLLSFGFIAAFYFATNGINAMIVAFNASRHEMETRSWLNMRLVSFLLVLIITMLLTIAIGLIVFSQFGFNYLINLGWLKQDFTYYLLLSGKWLIIIGLFFFTISFLYYFAPSKKKNWRFISAGSTLATLLSILISVGFSFYVNNFGQYNKLYGSIGTIIVILLWLYFNALVLLIGFELNASIKNAKIKRKED
jgi:membrane protein